MKWDGHSVGDHRVAISFGSIIGSLLRTSADGVGWTGSSPQPITTASSTGSLAVRSRFVTVGSLAALQTAKPPPSPFCPPTQTPTKM